MAERKENSKDTAGRELLVTRTLNAPVELVWEVWTNPNHIKNWWGPNGFTNTIHKMEVKPGGLWEFVMHAPDGTDYKNKSIFKEVVKHERIVFEHLNPNFTATISFVADGNKTHIKWHMLFESKELFEQIVKAHKADEGLKQNVEKLEKYLARQQTNETRGRTFTITRVFNAPVQLVFKVFSQAGHLAQWWGPKGFDIIVHKMEFKPGGIFHYYMVTPDQNRMWGRFIYREIEEPVRIVFVNSFSDENGNITRAPFNTTWPLEVLNTLTLSEQDGKTTLTLVGCPINATEDECQVFVNNFDSMQQGFGGTFDQLENYLTKIESEIN